MRKERLEYLSAHFAVQFAHAIYTATAPKSEIGHIERLCIVSRILSSDLQQFVKRDAKFILRIMVKILPDKLRVKAIEPCGDRSVCRKDISGPRNSQSKIERLLVFLH